MCHTALLPSTLFLWLILQSKQQPESLIGVDCLPMHLFVQTLLLWHAMTVNVMPTSGVLFFAICRPKHLCNNGTPKTTLCFSLHACIRSSLHTCPRIVPAAMARNDIAHLTLCRILCIPQWPQQRHRAVLTGTFFLSVSRGPPDVICCQRQTSRLVHPASGWCGRKVQVRPEEAQSATR